MKKIMLSILLCGALSVSHTSMAASLGADMWALSKHYKAFNKADSQPDALKSLAAMREAATDAKQAVPRKLKSLPADDAQLLDYQRALDSLIAEIDKTATLVQANQLEQAKLEAKHMLMIRDESHQKFK